eukprot:36846-Pelagomonas_calceolata.AAC.6
MSAHNHRHGSHLRPEQASWGALLRQKAWQTCGWRPLQKLNHFCLLLAWSRGAPVVCGLQQQNTKRMCQDLWETLCEKQRCLPKEGAWQENTEEHEEMASRRER